MKRKTVGFHRPCRRGTVLRFTPAGAAPAQPPRRPLSAGSFASVFVVQQGRVLHALVTTGIYLDDPDVVHDLFAPLLEEWKKQYGT